MAVNYCEYCTQEIDISKESFMSTTDNRRKWHPGCYKSFIAVKTPTDGTIQAVVRASPKAK